MARYSFTGLAPGDYGVQEIQPTGYFPEANHVGTAGGVLVPPDAITQIPLISGTIGLHYDFFQLEPASISGYVYADDHQDGVMDPGDPGIAGVTVTLLDASGNPTSLTAVTDANGYYHFDNLQPGVYGVAETRPSGYYDGRASAGNAGGTAHNPGDSITGGALNPGVQAQNYDFGLLPPASVSGLVFTDNSDDGQFEPGDAPIPGVTIYLLDASGTKVASTTTDQYGQYSFADLQPAVYSVEKVPPAGYLDGQDSVGTAGGVLNGDDRIDQIALAPGTEGANYDFAELLPATISGYVFQDGPAIVYAHGDQPPDPYTLRDGKFTASDPRLAGVTLTLGDQYGLPILGSTGQSITTVTDSSGYYQFSGLRPGTYTIIEAQPTGYIRGINTVGSDGGFALNPNAPVDVSVLAVLKIDAVDTDAIVLIPIQPGDAGIQYNFSEILMNEAPAPPPVSPPPPPSSPLTPLAPTHLPMPPKAPSAPTMEAAPMIGSGPLPLPWAGGGLPIDDTWHLSIIDAGQPRSELGGVQVAADPRETYFSNVAWSGPTMSQGLWILADSDGNSAQTLHFGPLGGTPVTGDWSGDGVSKIGVFLDGIWFLDLNGNGVWDEDDLWARLGKAGDQPLVGDWDGDGKTDIGIFGPVWPGDWRAIEHEPGLPDVKNRRPGELAGRYKNIPPDPQQATVGWRTLQRTAFGKFRKDLIDHVFKFGSSGDVAVAGDWNGDGVTNIGIFHHGTWFLDMDGDGKWSKGDVRAQFGQPGDIPVVGDWTGDGVKKIGVYRKGVWYLDTNNNHVLDAQDKVLRLGGPDDLPVVGDWNGDGVDKIGIYRTGQPTPARQAQKAAEDSPPPVAADAPMPETVAPAPAVGASPAAIPAAVVAAP